MSKTLYLECYSGISGDMTVAALLDLGADREVLKESLKSLPVGGFRTEITRVKKSGLDACDFSVILEQDNHDHDMEYLHGSEKSYTGHHEYTHSHEYPHEHRGMKEITEIIQKSEMTAKWQCVYLVYWRRQNPKRMEFRSKKFIFMKLVL